MDIELKKELCGAIMNTSVAMMTLLKQLHSELGHSAIFELAGCPLCAQYIQRDNQNYELVKRVMEEE